MENNGLCEVSFGGNGRPRFFPGNIPSEPLFSPASFIRLGSGMVPRKAGGVPTKLVKHFNAASWKPQLKRPRCDFRHSLTATPLDRRKLPETNVVQSPDFGSVHPMSSTAVPEISATMPGFESVSTDTLCEDIMLALDQSLHQLSLGSASHYRPTARLRSRKETRDDFSSTKPIPRLSGPINLGLQGATRAALEVNHIAKAYDFDLIYTVRVWQCEKRHHVPLSRFNPAYQEHLPILNGQLLAAYGLEHLPVPLHISALVQENFRQYECIEHCANAVKPCDMVYGHSFSFCSTCIADGVSGDASAARQPMKQHSYSFVFAAYRKSRLSVAGYGHIFNEAELKQFYDVAKGFVGRLNTMFVAASQSTRS